MLVNFVVNSEYCGKPFVSVCLLQSVILKYGLSVVISFLQALANSLSSYNDVFFIQHFKILPLTKKIKKKTRKLKKKKKKKKIISSLAII